MQEEPVVVDSKARLRALLDAERSSGKRIGLVPTMGALHEGHLSLVRASRAECDYTVVSIFVNPTQFSPNEDLNKYPRTLQADLAALAKCGAELAFVPPADEVYVPDHATWVVPEGVALRWEGACRPTHFRGVATVVLKLFNMVQPHVAYFGQKDFQQARVIEQMVRDLDVPVEIRVCPIVREADGLAMSSRNAYLSPAARRRALVLWQSLELACELVAGGETSTEKVETTMRRHLETAKDARIEYIALVTPETLEPLDHISGPTLAALAVWIENTRLIDNRLLYRSPS